MRVKLGETESTQVPCRQVIFFKIIYHIYKYIYCRSYFHIHIQCVILLQHEYACMQISETIRDIRTVVFMYNCTVLGRNEGVLLTEQIIRAEAPKHVRNVVARLFIDRFSPVLWYRKAICGSVM